MIVKIKGADFSACGIGKIPVRISKECRDIAANYSLLNTTEELIALQGFMDDLGYGVEGSIWDKMLALYLPVVSTTKEEMLYNVKNGVRATLSENVLYAPVEGGGMMIANGSVEEYHKYLIYQNYGGEKRYKLSNFTAKNVFESRDHIGIADGIGGVWRATNGELMINALTVEGGTTGYVYSKKKKTVGVTTWSDVVESEVSNNTTSVVKLWDNTVENKSGKVHMDDTLKNRFESFTLSIGVGYNTTAIKERCINYIEGAAYDLTDAECVTLRDAMVKMLTALGVELDM